MNVVIAKVKKATKTKTKVVKTVIYSCNVQKCDYTSDGKWGLNSHIQLKHFIYQHLLKNKSEKEFECKECGNIFTDLMELPNHIINDCEKTQYEYY